MKLKFWKTAIFAKNRSFSFIKWKPLIQETWFLSHSLGDFVELNAYLEHFFFVKTLRFIEIRYFPWPFYDSVHFMSGKCWISINLRALSKNCFKYTFKSLKFPREWDKNQASWKSGFHFMKEKLQFFAKNCCFSKIQPHCDTSYYCPIKMKLCLYCRKFNLV